MQTITSRNPATNQELETYQLMDKAMIEGLIVQAHHAFLLYKKTTFSERADMMRKAEELLEQRKHKLAETMTMEMGKTLKSAIAEVEKCAWVCKYYAQHAEQFLADEIVETEATKSMISYRPIGVVLAVMPWNYPLWQVFRFAAPALMAGNTCLLKHASNVPQCALHIEEIFSDAGFPEYTFRSLIAKSDQVEGILQHKYVRAATLTGSGPAGSAVAATAGGEIKKTVLELGGNDAYLILEDADLEQAAEQCTASRLLNAGQSCIGAKRFVVLDEVYEEFMELFTEKMSNATMGDPLQDHDLGPMARHDLRDEVHQQVVESVAKGAKLILGGNIPDSEGAFYPPTILTEVGPGQPAYEEEIFGPVASVIRVKDEEEAIKIANDSKFGLGSCIFTKDVSRGERIAKDEIDAGCCFVNQFVKSDPRLPFGGVKASGYGRELSYYGIREFVNIKSIYIK